jgi:hypothetical protein
LGFGSLSVLEWMTDDISEKIPQQPSTTSADLCLEVNPDTEHTFFGAGNTSASPQAVFGNDISIGEDNGLPEAPCSWSSKWDRARALLRASRGIHNRDRYHLEDDVAL